MVLNFQYFSKSKLYCTSKIPRKILERYNQLHLNLIPDDWQTEWQKLKDNQEKHTEKDLEHHKQEDLKPVNLPTDWEQQLTSIETLNDKIKRLESDKANLQQQVSQLSSTSSPDKQVYLSLQKENDWLWETVELLNTGWLQYKLWLDSIEDEKETDEAINNLLEDTILYWRTYLESEDKNIFYKMPVLGSRFNSHENRTKAFNLITTMTKILKKEKTLEQLLIEWHGGKAWIDYNKKYDFDDSLWAFTQLLYLKKKYHIESEPKSKENEVKNSAGSFNEFPVKQIGVQTEIKKEKEIERMPELFTKN